MKAYIFTNSSNPQFFVNSSKSEKVLGEEVYVTYIPNSAFKMENIDFNLWKIYVFIN